MIKRNWKRIIASLLLIVMFFPNVNSLAYLEQSVAGEYIAKFAYDVVANYGNNGGTREPNTIYDFSPNRESYGYFLKVCPSRYSNKK